MSQTIKQDPSSSSSSLPLALAAVSPPSSPLTIASRSPSPPAWFDPATNKTKTKKTVSFAEEDEVRIITPRKVTGAKKASKTKTLAYSSSSSSSSNNNDMQEIQSEAFVPRRSVRAIVISKRKAEADADAAVAVTKRVKKEKTSAVTATTAAGNKKGKAKGKEIDAAEEAPSGPGKLGRGKGEVVEVAAPVGHNATSAAEPDARVTRSLSRKRSAVEDAVGAGGAAKKQKIGESSRVGELVGGGGSSSGAREHIPGRGAIAGNAALQPGENGVYYLALGKDMCKPPSPFLSFPFPFLPLDRNNELIDSSFRLARREGHCPHPCDHSQSQRPQDHRRCQQRQHHHQARPLRLRCRLRLSPRHHLHHPQRQDQRPRAPPPSPPPPQQTLLPPRPRPLPLRSRRRSGRLAQSPRRDGRDPLCPCGSW